MEEHPIPQDVTGFQFKLIGDMTVKQFAYLVAGGTIAWIFFSLPIPLIIKMPISIFFVILGISLAFLPLAGRPMDLMLMHFIKAVFNPAQFVYRKTNSDLLFPQLNNYGLSLKKGAGKTTLHSASIDVQNKQNKAAQQKVFLEALPKAQRNKLDEKETDFFGYLFGPKTTARAVPAGDKTIWPNVISMRSQNPEDNGENLASPLRETEALSKKAIIIEKALEDAKKEEAVAQKAPLSNADTQHQNVLDLERQLQEVLGQKEKLTQEIMSLREKLKTQKQEVYTPTTASLKKETKNVRRIPISMGKTVGLPMAPDAPNLLVGIVKNPRGQSLPNILVEVKDAEGNAVRAFKTNGIGRFASATPLINGIYTITFEDSTKQNKFDAVELAVNGTIIMPLEVVSTDTREELKRSLFGQV